MNMHDWVEYITTNPTATDPDWLRIRVLHRANLCYSCYMNHKSPVEIGQPIARYFTVSVDGRLLRTGDDEFYALDEPV